LGIGPSPWEYVELRFCRDIYHCTPNELAEVPYKKILAHLACMDGEEQYRKYREKHPE
jgi:hypothetical protein